MRLAVNADTASAMMCAHTPMVMCCASCAADTRGLTQHTITGADPNGHPSDWLALDHKRLDGSQGRQLGHAVKSQVCHSTGTLEYAASSGRQYRYGRHLFETYL